MLLALAGDVGGKDVYAAISSSSDNWQYLKCHPLVFLIDGKAKNIKGKIPALR